MSVIDKPTLTEALPAGDAPVGRSGRLGVRLVASKLASAVFVLWGTVTVTFVVLAVLPGDRATILLNVRSGQQIPRSAAELAPINHEFGFDRSVVVQYVRYLGDLLHGDLGISYQSDRPVSTIIGEQIAPTFTLALAALVLAWLLTVGWTLLTAGRSVRLRSLGSAVETISAGLPQYWVGILLLIVFAAQLGWFPVIGGTSLTGTVLPVATLAIPLAGFLGQATRSEFDRAIREPFAVSARARGMSDLAVRARHVLRHALIPGITLSGWAMGSLLSGAVLVETVYARPGLGAVLVTAVSQKDFAVVSGIVILISLLYVVINLLVDVVYALVDPRLRGAL
ncbi:peptide/nickel transport system permease protein [Jatrophihabitans endophyticus]|uniref:Peptide/nickel transport system permease protein n=1 Tax=Jatrophihabitans endophyticus TaxID=1206085 RepID=A0A1M5DR58_9ACTN|nr:ABC transporter permease [Jatrophihabitans endophyticus]SHF69467.1 peptide/nickel transport system permease protein [Jatrophihabitans endophyticus]